MTYKVLTDWVRRPHWEFYRQNPHPFYSVSFELDASSVRARARSLGGSTYASLCWAFHRALLQVDAFRVRFVDGEIVLYDTLQVGMTIPGPEGTFTFATPPWHTEAATFLASAAQTFAGAGQVVDLTQGNSPEFAYYTSLPAVPFTSFAHVPHGDADAGQLQTAFGRFTEKSGRVMVPVGLTVNHRYVDGAHLGELYEALQASYASAF